ncbi:phosphatidylinositol-3,4,5-trisphosphate 3-phosphatase, putative [Entamoeba histolytica HM-1:IMSS-B]|uniref:Phosphatidylinositol 3,4,5-trisphosphate 3-phosphatase and dual-specificity protein phosphatase PTEN n=4 Tax=Entamoeba histolytica TaxID=5759 RepID=C4LXC6_ENTH1|nr:phosphatidylinositol-3,4,5-trisphosphate 3-phosphatase, putative [Entamoeba histolytica HM-1:IMSS]EAL50635.2 phosphatidylinositol-3,4,5-trisphosphate 3-phosphatase, putative [Entamoeba histolytica HM-1:IMSS]EMD46262.1 phosphatidylinositol3,4,5-trisphosphate 3-phosphatase, putative [Entamoeba histolytica KU27]EMH72691.1 phosphatidylinositol-3,4,5-trisphosphate 3-phosphatase, putative [Entamoeba histolytica HM-1:IMSS-B]ENY63628.1 phosphatidylinositol-3,4,5-trisphosphate 3-phosphatase, putative|eukprot:XP_656021.2 phosphatidylinositol-3,4,5-trisphosphate 3-phosphatase, putative [Entamoeba histolytica HM-1:IMSS]
MKLLKRCFRNKFKKEEELKKIMSSFLREAVSKEKKRYQKFGFDLDLSYITPRIITMGFPSEKFEAAYRNPFPDVMNFLDTFHGGHYKVYNFCSEKPYDGEHKIKGEYCYFPFDDHNAPQFEIISQLCKDVDEFLSRDPQNVIALHCKAGKGRTGLIDCLHSYEAVDLYGNARTYDKKGVTIPSQLKYVGYWGSTLLAKLPYGQRKLKLISITMKPIPKINEDLRIKIFLWKTIQCDKALGTVRGGKGRENKNKREADIDLFDKIYEEIKQHKPDVSIRETICAWDWKMREQAGSDKYGEESITFPIENVNLMGDVKVEVYSQKLGQLFTVWFNTWFVKGTTLTLTKLELDKGCRDEKFLAPNFTLTIQFEELETIIKEENVPTSISGINELVTPDMVDLSSIPPRCESVIADLQSHPGDIVFGESWGVVANSVYAPSMYPNYHLAANFNLYEKVLDHLLTPFPSIPLNQISSKKFDKTTRSPLEVSRSLLYAIISLYLRSGFYGRVNDVDIESIYLDKKQKFAIFEAQSTELAVISLLHLKDEEKEPFWLNIYHTMLLHGLIYMKHRPYPDHRTLMEQYKKIVYKIDGLDFTLQEVLCGMLRAPFGKDDSLGSNISYPSTSPKVKFVCKEKDNFICFLISFGMTSSPPIWLYETNEFTEQKRKAINQFIGTQCAALGNSKTIFVPQTMKMFVKDFKNEKNFFKELLKIYNITESGWNLKWQNVERECGIWLDHLNSEGITVTHRDVPYLAQYSMFHLASPKVLMLKIKLAKELDQIRKMKLKQSTIQFTTQRNKEENQTNITVNSHEENQLNLINKTQKPQIYFSSVNDDKIILQCEAGEKISISVGETNQRNMSLKRGFYKISYGTEQEMLVLEPNFRHGPAIDIQLKPIRIQNQIYLLITFNNYCSETNDTIVIFNQKKEVTAIHRISQERVKQFVMNINQCKFNIEYEVRLIQGGKEGWLTRFVDYNSLVYSYSKTLSIDEKTFNEMEIEKFN